MRVRAREHARKAAEEDRRGGYNNTTLPHDQSTQSAAGPSASRNGKQGTSVEVAQGGRVTREHTSVEVELDGFACNGTVDQCGTSGEGGGNGGRSAAASESARQRREEIEADGMAAQRRASGFDGDAMELD